MLKTLYRSTAVALLVAFGAATVPAAADTGGPFASTVVDGANTALKNAMDQWQADQTKALHDGTVAQVPPVQQQPVGGTQQQGLPTGFTYFADFSIAKPFGNIGGKTNWLPGGMDGSVAYGFTPNDRVVASYYELQHYPYGFNSGNVNVYLPPGFPITPGVNPTQGNLATLGPDVTTKDSFLLLSYEKLITLTKIHGRALPLVITPTYVSRWSKIAASGNGSDVVPFVDAQGVAHTNINTRTAQYDSVAFTLPFLKTPKMFGTFTLAPTWLTHLNGINQVNKTQLYEIAYLEYNLNQTTRFFLEPQLSKDYLPTDPYAQHIAAYFLGATKRVGQQGFVQLVLNSGGPTNYQPYGIGYLQCVQLPCSAHTYPYVGGLKATQLQLQFGIGSPVVLPF